MVGWPGYNRLVQTSADHNCDVSERHALLGHTVIFGSRGALLKRQPEEACSIEPVDRGPKKSFCELFGIPVSS
jgi:hypothetical protein